LGPYFDGKLIAITHIAILGWATMIIFGALYQLIPIVFETALFSETLAKINFWIFAISISSLSYSFWVNAFSTLLIYASILLLISLLLFITNVLMTHKNSKKKNIQSRYIITAIYWLLLTVILGTLIAFNFRFNFFEKLHLHYLKIHAHIGLIGWFLLLIIGISSTLIPMFFISHNLKEKKIQYAYYLINIGLVGLMLDWFLINTNILVYLNWLLISSGIILFLSYAWDSYKQRLRKVLDTGMKQTVIALLVLIVPIVLAIILLIGFNLDYSLLLRATTLYGFSIIFGFITSLILGQTYKTLPFIIWLEKYQKYVGKFKTVMPKDLYSEKLAQLQMYFYVAAIIILSSALLTNQPLLATIGSYTLLTAAITYNINLFKIVLHKTKIESLK
ncbi:MAG: hypothetical protein GY936_12820, partial [Ignavibacteriae bacterium]|nr:hypothetical protein [Ignavibacteriota bacterium]